MVNTQIADHGIIHAKMVAMRAELDKAKKNLAEMEAKAVSPVDMAAAAAAQASMQACSVNMDGMETEIAALEESIRQLTKLVERMDEETKATLTDFDLIEESTSEMRSQF